MLGPADTAALERLERAMGEGFQEIKGLINNLDQRLRAIENQQGRPCEIEAIRMAQRETAHNELRRDFELLKSRVDVMEPWVMGMRWAVGLIGAGVLGALVKLFFPGA